MDASKIHGGDLTLPPDIMHSLNSNVGCLFGKSILVSDVTL